ncbi:MAG TPA: metallophosphoesterase family protein [Trichocoleus sp.]|jgi:putative phosphoesterase
MNHSNPVPQQIGIISDTHGLLRPEAIAALEGSGLILHAGDIGNPEVLVALNQIAPVVAVRGNNDRGEWAESIAEREMVQREDISIYLLHIIQELDFNPVTQNVQIVVSGHSHKPSISERAGVLFINPGSAGPRRFKLPITVARLQILGKAMQAEIIDLAIS